MNLSISLEQPDKKLALFGAAGYGRPGGRANADTDPLGRELRDSRFRDGDAQGRVDLPDVGMNGIKRAQRALEELRKRLGETERPQLELDYIERLLKGLN